MESNADDYKVISHLSIPTASFVSTNVFQRADKTCALKTLVACQRRRKHVDHSMSDTAHDLYSFHRTKYQ